MRILALATLILGIVAALPAAEPTRPLAPTEITWEKSGAVLGELAKHLSDNSGVPIVVPANLLKAKCEVKFDRTPFWEALQTAADKSNTRISLANGGRKVEITAKGNSRVVTATSGAFRVVTQQVIGRALLDQGLTFHEVILLVHWEPRLRVYRIDTSPTIRKVEDVPGTKLTADTGGTQFLPLDATSELRVRITGLTRDSGKITSLAGVFTVTAAEKLLQFAFEVPEGKLPPSQTQSGVTASLKRVEKRDDTWEIEVEVTYPANQPLFESFQGEWWLRDNRLTVRGPDAKSFVIDDYEVPTPDNPRPLRVIHRFKEDAAKGLGNPTAKGWSIVYETPSPLSESKIPFELKDIPLP